MSDTNTLRGKLRTWDLSGGDNPGRRYINADVNFALLRKYFSANFYDVFSGTGEQRQAKKRHVNKLKSEISNNNYTPTVFQSAVTDSCKVEIDSKGNVTIPLSEDDKLSLLDGNHRMQALLELHAEGGATAKKTDNLPITLIVSLDKDRRKSDFANLQYGLPINRSHLLSMQIDNGHVDSKKLTTFVAARDLAKLLHTDKNSPFFEQISFGATDEGGIAFNVICSDKRGDAIASLFTTVKMGESSGRSHPQILELFFHLWTYINDNTGCAAKGKLLCIPPNGPKGTASLLVGVFNVWQYYLYLNQRQEPAKKDWSTLKNALGVFDADINKDLSTARKKTLLCAFSQNIFDEMANDNSSPVGMHFGVPISLLCVSSASSLGLEEPPKAIEPPKELTSNQVESTSEDSDTDLAFLL